MSGGWGDRPVDPGHAGWHWQSHWRGGDLRGSDRLFYRTGMVVVTRHPHRKKVPRGLEALSGVLWEVPDFKVSGVYFLCRCKRGCKPTCTKRHRQELVYIGASCNLANRLARQRKNRPHDEAYFLPVHTSQLFEVEAAMIRWFNPPLNKSDRLYGGGHNPGYRGIVEAYIRRSNR